MFGQEERSDPQLQARLAGIRHKVSSVQGWVGDEAGMNLYRLARFHAPSGIIVELGSWRGRSTIWLAHAVQDRGEGKVYAVDTWEGTGNGGACLPLLQSYGDNQLFEEFRNNMNKAGIASYVEPIVGNTGEVLQHLTWEKPIGLLFIDADHEYESVRQDFELWSPYVMEGGFIVFDDVPAWPGPTRLVKELPPRYRFKYAGWNNYVVQKRKEQEAAISWTIQAMLQKDDEAYAAELYRELLGREPDVLGLEHCKRLLAAGVPRLNLLAAILQGKEADGLFHGK